MNKKDLETFIRTNQCKGGDLSGVDFTDKNIFKETRIVNAMFDGTDLSNVNFSNCYFTNCSFKKTNLKNANFTDTIIKYSSFYDADLSKSIFSRANILIGNFNESILDDADFSNSQISYASTFDDVIGIRAKFVNTKFYKTPYENTVEYPHDKIPPISFSDSTLMESNFNNSVAEEPLHFLNTNLKNSQLNHSNLSLCTFFEANLENSSFQFSNMSDCFFHKTILTNANHMGAKFKNAYLDKAIDFDLFEYDQDLEKYEEVKKKEAKEEVKRLLKESKERDIREKKENEEEAKRTEEQIKKRIRQAHKAQEWVNTRRINANDKKFKKINKIFIFAVILIIVFIINDYFSIIMLNDFFP
jgi:uncharacterized protein YjbI with pentapeptide repeats